MIRGSNLHRRTCSVCAAVCERCVKDCGQFGDDAKMKACTEACRLCAESCGQMAT